MAYRSLSSRKKIPNTEINLINGKKIEESHKPSPKKLDSIYKARDQREIKAQVYRDTTLIRTLKYGSIPATIAVFVAIIVLLFVPLFKPKPTISAVSVNSQFASTDEPVFKLNSGGLVKTKNMKYGKGSVKVESSTITASVTRDVNIGNSEVIPEISSDNPGSDTFNVKVPKPNRFKPGAYKLKVIIQTPKVEQTLEQDFKWGVLAINPDKGIYSSGENAFIAMGVLDDSGHMVCDAKASLQVVDPTGKIEILSTENGKIIISDTCKDYSNKNPKPDYYASYKTGLIGKYTMRLHVETKNGPRDMEDGFIVQDQPTFDVTRDAPTRIFPTGPIGVKITVRANVSYTGNIQEVVPASFVLSRGDFIETLNGDQKILTWNRSFKMGETQVLEYFYDPPHISPEFYLTGPLTFVTEDNNLDSKITFQEPRQWEIASDASCTFTVGAAASWTTAAWASCNSSYPGATAVGDTATITWSGVFALTVNATIPYSLASVTVVATTNASVITFGGAYTMNVTTSPGTVTLPQKITTSGTNAINVNTGTLNTSGNLSLPGTTTTASYIARVVVSSGTLFVGSTGGNTASITTQNTAAIPAANALISLTGAGTVRVNGPEAWTCGTLSNSGTAGTYQFDSTFTYGSTVCAPAFTSMAAENIIFNGNISTVSGAADVITFNATSTVQINASLTETQYASATFTFGNVQINSGATLTLAYAMTVAGNWTNNSAASGFSGLTPSTYTVTFSGTTKTIGGTANTGFYRLTIANGATRTLNTSASTGGFTFATGSTATTFTHGSSAVDLTVNGTATINQPSGAVTKNWLINAGTATVTGEIIIPSTSTTTTRIAQITITSGTLNANGGIDTSGATGGSTAACHVINMSGGAGTLNLKGAIQTVNAAGAGGWTFTMGTAGSSFVYDDTNAQTIYIPGIGGYNNLVSHNTAGATTNVAISATNVTGNVDVGDGTVAGILIDSQATMVGSAGTSIHVNNNAIFRMTGASTAIPTGFGTFTFDAASTVQYQQTNTPITIVSATYGNLEMEAAGTATQNFPAAAISILGNLTIGNGTNATTAVANGAYTIEVDGNWTLSSGSTFTHSNGTVNLNGPGGSTQTIAGTNTFYNLTATATTARTIDFTAGTTTTVAGTWTVTGVTGQRITLTSTTTSTWTIDPTAASISYADINYSTSNLAICATYSVTTSGGNNANWTITAGSSCGATVTGSIYSDEGTTKYTTAVTVGIKVNGAGSGTCSNTSGDFTCSSIAIGAIGDTITVYLDSASVSGATVTRAASTSATLSGLHIYQDRLILRHEDAGPVTNADINYYDSDNNANLEYTVTTGALAIQNTQELHVWSAKTYNPGGTVTTNAGGTSGNVHIAGTMTMGTNALSVGGVLHKCWNF